jgi:heptosyltransferase II
LWDDTPSSVLVIQTAFIGDVVLVIPLLRAIHDAFPTAMTDVVVRPPADNLLETLPYIRKVICYDKLDKDKGLSGFLRMRGELRRYRYDLAIIPHRSFRSGALAYFSGIQPRVGFKRGGGRIFHSMKVPYLKSQHEIDRNLSLLTPLNINIQPVKPEVFTSDEDIAGVTQLLTPLSDAPIIAFAPGSVWFSKRWVDVNFAVLGDKLVERGNQILLIGSTADRRLCERLAREIGRDTLSIAGKTTLRQTVEALRRTKLLVSNDSAPTHFGVAAGCKVLTVFGSTSPDYGFGPYGKENRTLGIELYCRPCTDHGRKKCPEKHFRCMRELSAERVLLEIEIMLGDRKRC